MGWKRVSRLRVLQEEVSLLRTTSTAYMYNIFIDLCVGGHLGYFPVLAIVDSVAMNVGTCVFSIYDFLRV